ncbi:MAG TPA: hypothetical protein VFQ79_17665 [Bryobacteraceae bacterium]|nr:hypothetical protein [Bryobacteraceae bacterium]
MEVSAVSPAAADRVRGRIGTVVDRRGRIELFEVQGQLVGAGYARGIERGVQAMSARVAAGSRKPDVKRCGPKVKQAGRRAFAFVVAACSRSF